MTEQRPTPEETIATLRTLAQVQGARIDQLLGIIKRAKAGTTKDFDHTMYTGGTMYRNPTWDILDEAKKGPEE